MKIVELKVENVKRLSAVNIKPDGSLVVIGGRHGNGKSSVLDSIMYALAGTDSLPPAPIRNGASKGQVTVRLDDITVTRKFSRKEGGEITTSLEIRRSNGDKVSSPQALLDSLCGKLAFDPLEFSRLKPKAQLESLKELVGLDFTELDRKRQALFDRRTEVNRDAKNKSAELAACPLVDGVPDAPVSVAELSDELQRREKLNRENGSKRAKASDLSEEIDLAERGVEIVEEEIKKLQAKLDARKAELVAVRQSAAAAAQEAAALVDADCEEVRTKIRDSESTNAKVRQNLRHAELSKSHLDLTLTAGRLTSEIDAIDQDKAKQIAAAKFPVPGLSFGTEGVLLNGLPLEQACTADRIRLSVAMGLALNPKLRVMLIREGSLLFDDDTGLRLIGDMAEQANAQVWVERVSLGSECSVIIEDGHVAQEKELAAA